MSETNFFDLSSDNKTVTVSCAGNLVVRGDVGATVRFKSDFGAPVNVVDQHITASGNLKIQLPKGAHLMIEKVSGNASIKGVQSGVSVSNTVGGNLTINSSDGDVVTQTVNGNARFINVSGLVTVKGKVQGNVVAKNVTDLTVKHVSGDLTAKRISGNLTASNVSGNAGVRNVVGDLTILQVRGDVALAEISGTVDVKSADDIRFSGPLSPGKHKLDAASTIDFRYPINEPLTISAQSNVLEMQLEFDTVVNGKEGVVDASIGSGGPMVTLIAPERLRIRPISDASNDFNIYADVDLDFGDIEMELSNLGERISAEVNARMSEITTNIGPEIGIKAEQAIRAAQAAVERAANKMEIEVRRAQNRATKPDTPTKPKAPPAPPKSPNPPKPDTTQAQLEILKMLESGKITVQEANQLLAALG